MFARRVSIYLKDNGVVGFQQKIDEQVIPLLRKQTGFVDALTFLYPNRKEVHSISLWQTAEDADAYSRNVYPEVMKILSPVVDVLEGITRVQTYEVLNATFGAVNASAMSA
jgi:hypothetical protein